ncbi:MAG: hypothetical protein HRT35_34285, partial [Algicola sp.]|nr:hypothetical protein [Algicola sp.]
MINKKSRFTLYDAFRQGAIPSGADFAELIKSNINCIDDGVDVSDDPNEPIKIRGHGDYNHLFDFCDDQWQPQWRLSQSDDSADLAGLNFTASLQSRLFIARQSGNVGISTDQPNAKLHIKQVGASDALRIDDEASDTSPFIINSQGYIGAGTLVPQASFHISNSTNVDHFRVDITGEADDNAPFVIKTNGNVGIGFALPDAKVAINGGLNVGGTTDPGDDNALISGTLIVNTDSYLGQTSVNKVVLPGTLQSTDNPADNTALVVNDSLDVRNNLKVGGDAEFGASADDTL